jgi:hypothetical protein
VSAVRRLLVAAAAAACLVLALTAAPAAAQGGSCTALPDPVAYGTPFTLTLTAATPNAYYVAQLSEAGLPGVYDPLLLGETDATGTVTVTSSDWTYLTAGTVRVKWYALNSDNNYQGGTVTCMDDVTVTS